MRRTVVYSDLQPADVAQTLRRLSDTGEIPTTEQQLQAAGVNSLHFLITTDGACRITSKGLARRRSRGPRLAVSGRLRILGPSLDRGQSAVDVRFGLTPGTWIAILGWLTVVTVCFGLLGSLPGLLGAFLFFGAFPAGIWLLQADAFLGEVWPPLITEVQRLINDTARLPAA